MADYSEIKTENLEDMIRRHEERGATHLPGYREAIEELAKRRSKDLKLQITLDHLKDCARRKVFTSYKAVAELSEANWSKVHWQMPGHLDHVLQICHSNHWPLLTSLCVNQDRVDTGELAENSLAGFIKGAKRLGYSIIDDHKFLRDCQQQAFAWGTTN